MEVLTPAMWAAVQKSLLFWYLFGSPYENYQECRREDSRHYCRQVYACELRIACTYFATDKSQCDYVLPPGYVAESKKAFVEAVAAQTKFCKRRWGLGSYIRDLYVFTTR